MNPEQSPIISQDTQPNNLDPQQPNPGFSGPQLNNTKGSHRKLIVITIIVAVVLGTVGGVFALSASRDKTSKSSTGSVTPEMQRVQECLQSKNISSDDWTAYQKAANDCQTR